MVPVLGRYAGLLTVGLLGLVVFGPLAVFLPLWSALTLGALASGVASLALTRIATLKARCEKLSGEVDLLSRRLLKVETAAANAAVQPPPETAEAALLAQIEELTVEFGLLSGIVRDLTTVVSTQDAEIADLKARPEIRPENPPAPAPAASPEPAPQRPRVTAAPPAAHRAPPDAPPMAETPPSAPTTPARSIPPRPFPPQPARDPGSEAEIIRAFEGEGLEIHLQPVVTLPQRKVVAYEALARLRIGGTPVPVEPETFLPVLERYGRTTELDRRMLQRAAIVVRHLARRGSETTLTYGLSPLSLFEPGLLRELARTAADDPTLAGGLVLALPQASWRGLDAGQRSLLAALRDRIGFSLDRPDDLRFDAAELAALGIGQVKVPADMLLRSGSGRGGLSDIAVEDTAPALARAGIRLVAMDVADEADVPDLIDLDVPFAQGAAFATPRPVRAEVLSAPPTETPTPPTEPEPERRPFRSVLRRAV